MGFLSSLMGGGASAAASDAGSAAGNSSFTAAMQGAKLGSLQGTSSPSNPSSPSMGSQIGSVMQGMQGGSTPPASYAPMNGFVPHYDSGGSVTGNMTNGTPIQGNTAVNPNLGNDPLKNVDPLVNPMSSMNPGLDNAAKSAGASPLLNPSTYIVPAAVDGVQSFAAPLDAGVQSIMNHAGGIAQGAATAFTAQNNYQANLAPTSLSDYGSTINQAGNNSLNASNQLQGNINDLNQVAHGQGPNPAQNMLNASTGQNVSNQASLMAGQRGSSANPALLARQAAQQGAATQQQAIGQNATLQSQQQLNAMGTVGNEILGNQSNNNVLYNSAANAQNAQNSGQIQNYGMAQGINAGIAGQNTEAVNKTMGNVLGGASSLMALLSKGGTAGKDGYQHGPQSIAGRHLRGMQPLMAQGGMSKVPGQAQVSGNNPKNDTVPAMLSPGEIVIPRSVANDPEKAAAFARAVVMRNQKKGSK